MSAPDGALFVVPPELASGWPEVLSAVGFECRVAAAEDGPHAHRYLSGSVSRDSLTVAISAQPGPRTPSPVGRVANRETLFVHYPRAQRVSGGVLDVFLRSIQAALARHGAEPL